jgi:hypothetical protein
VSAVPGVPVPGLIQRPILTQRSNRDTEEATAVGAKLPRGASVVDCVVRVATDGACVGAPSHSCRN